MNHKSIGLVVSLLVLASMLSAACGGPPEPEVAEVAVTEIVERLVEAEAVADDAIEMEDLLPLILGLIAAGFLLWGMKWFGRWLKKF